MAISSPGLGSNINVESIVSQLMAVERQPLTALAKKEASFQSKLSAFGVVKGALSAFQTAAKAIATTDKLTPTKASVSDAAILTAASSSNAVPGTYNVEVQSLAQSQKLMTSTGYNSTSDVVGTGKITISFGTYKPTVPPVTDPPTPPGIEFVVNADKAGGTITIDDTNKTLSGVRDAINKANLGVTATILNDGTKNYLSFTSTETGARNALKISVDDPSLNALAYDATGTGSSMAEKIAAKDAVILVDTVKVTKPTNTITDAIQGVTLNLGKEAVGTTVKVNLTRDTASMQSSIEAFVKAYNDVSKTLKDYTAYNADTSKAAVLLGDSTMRSIQSQIRNVLTTPIAGAPATMNTLAAVGIEFQKDGTLSVDSAKLSKALADPTKDVAKLFTSTSSGQGFGYKMDVLMGRILSPVGILNEKTKSINESISDIGEQRTKLNSRMDTIENRYYKQFSALDVALSNMTKTSTYLTQQLSAMASSLNSSS
jgi:flagellar hook-associated protein 2